MINTLEDAIKHCNEVAESKDTCELCSQEHKQLAKWLTELLVLKSKNI